MSRVAGHPGVVGLRAVFEDDKEVHLVMDLCEGGELFDEVVRLGRLSERDAALIFRQLASGVAFCHSRGVLHRDLKPENILLHRSAPSGAVPASPAADSALAAPQSLESRGLTAKLADFGLSIALDNGRMGYGTAGSPFYMAPEVLTGEYEYAADVWSLGVILYIMLCGRPPFWGKTDAAVYDAILRGKLDFSGPAWAGVSVEARSLIRCMLQSDPRRRPTAVKVLSHPWVLLHLAAAVSRWQAREIAASSPPFSHSFPAPPLPPPPFPPPHFPPSHSPPFPPPPAALLSMSAWDRNLFVPFLPLFPPPRSPLPPSPLPPFFRPPPAALLAMSAWDRSQFAAHSEKRALQLGAEEVCRPHGQESAAAGGGRRKVRERVRGWVGWGLEGRRGRPREGERVRGWA
ncbi:unnamed protein product [Closterium sp. NIES-65]|nr:unnamed protein product [Closterium sp. NIES-65]